MKMMKKISYPEIFICTGQKCNGMSYSNEELYTVRNDADFKRIDMSRSQRKRHHRKIKLEKKDIVREEKNLFSSTH